jgi:hypothetical protein
VLCHVYEPIATDGGRPRDSVDEDLRSTWQLSFLVEGQATLIAIKKIVANLDSLRQEITMSASTVCHVIRYKTAATTFNMNSPLHLVPVEESTVFKRRCEVLKVPKLIISLTVVVAVQHSFDFASRTEVEWLPCLVEK